tara:strand:+ start:1306 stop:1629 length:324 start_codon:yes stop_codon:yes gene_type:complete
MGKLNKTINEIIEQIYSMSRCYCEDEHEIHLQDDDEYDNYFLYKNKYEAYGKVDTWGHRWEDYVDDAIYECGFTEEELALGYYYIEKTLYPQAQVVRTKHARRKTND